MNAERPRILPSRYASLGVTVNKWAGNRSSKLHVRVVVVVVYFSNLNRIHQSQITYIHLIV